MGYYAVIGGEESVSLASYQGWADFRKWAEGLDDEDASEVRWFSENGWSDALQLLENELQAAIEDHAPTDETVVKTAGDLLNALLSRDESAKSIFVTDGLSKKDGEDGWMIEGELAEDDDEEERGPPLIETKAGVNKPSLSRAGIVASHVKQLSALEEGVADALQRFFRETGEGDSGRGEGAGRGEGKPSSRAGRKAARRKSPAKSRRAGDS